MHILNEFGVKKICFVGKLPILWGKLLFWKILEENI